MPNDAVEVSSVAPPPAVPLISPRGLVFIGHSSRLRPDGELRPPDSPEQHRARKKYLAALLDALQHELEGRGFDVWVDRRNLPAGDDIDAVIHEALHYCRVGVLLVDHDALDADYMRNEANILMFQRPRRELLVLPVLLNGLTDEDVADSPLGRQTRVHRLRPLRPAPKTWETASAGLVAAEVAAEVDGSVPPGDSSLDDVVTRWLQLMMQDLAEVDPRTLTTAAQHLGVGAEAWRRSHDRRRTLVAALLACTDLKRLFKAVRAIVPSLRSAGTAERTVERVLPLWVDPAASRVVLETADLPPDERLLGLSTRDYGLGRHVVERTTLSSPDYEVLRLPDVLGEAPLEEWVSRCARTIREALHLDEDEDDDTIREDLDDLYNAVWALLRLDVLDAATAQYAVDEVQRRFGPLSFILLGYRQEAGWTRPPITDAYEDLDRDTERRAMTFVRRTNGLIAGNAQEVSRAD